MFQTGDVLESLSLVCAFSWGGLLAQDRGGIAGISRSAAKVLLLEQSVRHGLSWTEIITSKAGVKFQKDSAVISGVHFPKQDPSVGSKELLKKGQSPGGP